jgi:hypothetical protein
MSLTVPRIWDSNEDTRLSIQPLIGLRIGATGSSGVGAGVGVGVGAGAGAEGIGKKHVLLPCANAWVLLKEASQLLWKFVYLSRYANRVDPNAVICIISHRVPTDPAIDSPEAGGYDTGGVFGGEGVVGEDEVISVKLRYTFVSVFPITNGLLAGVGFTSPICADESFQPGLGVTP